MHPRTPGATVPASRPQQRKQLPALPLDFKQVRCVRQDGVRDAEVPGLRQRTGDVGRRADQHVVAAPPPKRPGAAYRLSSRTAPRAARSASRRCVPAGSRRSSCLPAPWVLAISATFASASAQASSVLSRTSVVMRNPNSSGGGRDPGVGSEPCGARSAPGRRRAVPPRTAGRRPPSPRLAPQPPRRRRNTAWDACGRRERPAAVRPSNRRPGRTHPRR